jgi:hypothetical protein
MESKFCCAKQKWQVAVYTAYDDAVTAQLGHDGNTLTPELNPSAQRCLTKIFYWGFCFLNRAFR